MTSRRQWLLYFLVAVMLLTADQAMAQVAGGSGGSGLLATAISWVVTNIIQGLLSAAILFVGCLLLFGRHTLAGVAVIAVGALVIANYQTIAGFFPVVGG